MWNWELELTPHVEKRMEDREFTEVDLRSMLARASALHVDTAPERFIVECSFRKRPWRVIVEPDPDDRRLIVITVYSIEE